MKLHFHGIASFGAVCAIAVLLLQAAAVSATDTPSHVEPPSSYEKGFELPSQSDIFTSLGTTSQAIMANVTTAQWANVSASYANYGTIAQNVSAMGITRTSETGVVSTIQSSKDDLGLFVEKARRYEELRERERILLENSSRGAESQNTAIAMRASSADIRHLSGDLNVSFGKIASFTQQNGLDASSYNKARNYATVYATKLEKDVNNVTTSVFQSTTTTLNTQPALVRYGDVLHVAGNVRANQAGVSKATVVISLENGTVLSQTITNRSGAYEAESVAYDVTPGTHKVIARFAPGGMPFNPSSSSASTVTVVGSGASNELSVREGPLGYNLIFKGKLVANTGSPVGNASVVPYANGNPYGGAVRTHPDGAYVFVYDQDLRQYLMSFLVPSQYQFYAVFKPSTQALNSTQSNVLDVNSGQLRPYAGFTLLGIGVLSSLAFSYQHVRQRRRVSAGKTLVPEVPELSYTSLPPPMGRAVGARHLTGIMAIEEIDDGIRQADELSLNGRYPLALGAIYEATVPALSAVCRARLSHDMTAREICFRISKDLPEVRTPLRELTSLFERARYSDRPIDALHVRRARAAAVSVTKLIRTQGESG